MRFKAAIFDLDGTLLDSLADIGNAANRVLESLDQPTHSLERYRTLVGDGVRVLFQRAFEDTNAGAATDQWLADCMHRFFHFYDDECLKETKAYPGIDDLLSELQTHQFALGVLSNKPDGFTKRLVQHYFPGVFSIVLGQRDEVPRKPDPIGVFEIQTQWSVPCDLIAYVGDTNTDMLTARNSGCFAIGVTWGFRSREELVCSGADVIAENASQLRAQILTL